MAVVTVTPTNYVPTNLGDFPCEKGNVVRVPLEFNGADDIEVDLSVLQQTGHFSAAQTLFMDNQTNAVAVSVFCEVSRQTFQVPIGGFIYMPLLQPNPPKLIFSCTAAIDLEVFFVNFFLPPVVWGPSISGGGGGGSAFYSETPNNHSSTIAVGGAWQTAIPANVNRKGFIISNPATATEVLNMRFAGAGTVDLQPGATYETGPGIWSGAIEVKAITAGHAYTAYEGT